LVDTCRTCDPCQSNLEQYCGQRKFTNARLLQDGPLTYGGYARDIVCEVRLQELGQEFVSSFEIQICASNFEFQFLQDKFVCRFPENLDLYAGSPLLCAGITAYSSLKKFGMDKPGKRLGVIGLGGVGHMAVKLGVAFGLEVTVISRSESKREESLGVLGAQKFLNSTDVNTFADAKGSLDFILDTVAAPKDINDYLSLLAVDGVMAMVAIPDAIMLQVI